MKKIIKRASRKIASKVSRQLKASAPKTKKIKVAKAPKLNWMERLDRPVYSAWHGMARGPMRARVTWQRYPGYTQDRKIGGPTGGPEGRLVWVNRGQSGVPVWGPHRPLPILSMPPTLHPNRPIDLPPPSLCHFLRPNRQRACLPIPPITTITGCPFLPNSHVVTP